MAHTFDELVAKQRAADEAHARVRRLRDAYGPPTRTKWSGRQTATWETAWRAWRDLARDVRIAVTEYARAEAVPRQEVEARLKRAAGHENPPGTAAPDA
ncbi:hypothetical protein [Streptomyces griseoloalbus]|uniref:Uncharacterized protein n=1 Tax=Streptomyces griseoloalbus TaxID=67303 RepID=A0A7W8FCZ9_9ACTN|nr:hypothetical protein [Streptomyces albaduncus]MBB5129001.1 hypothetical protein [Streptomyces albaduncus]GGV62329.1 hypothetical protein GCM10010294_12830 [Streptomyces griseoloalbus]GGW51370.1 hypothetical protein GCM10010340_32210 [Streptomyces albaduncus]